MPSSRHFLSWLNSLLQGFLNLCDEVISILTTKYHTCFSLCVFAILGKRMRFPDSSVLLIAIIWFCILLIDVLNIRGLRDYTILGRRMQFSGFFCAANCHNLFSHPAHWRIEHTWFHRLHHVVYSTFTSKIYLR